MTDHYAPLPEGTPPHDVIMHALKWHDAKSDRRAREILDAVTHQHDHGKEHEMSHGVEDKVDVKNIFHGSPDGMGGMGGGNLAGLAALANMNRSHGWGDGGMGFGGFGSGLVGGILGGLLFNRRGGVFGGDGGGEGCGQAVSDFVNLQTLGDIKAQIGQTACETQRTVEATGANNVSTTLQQTIALQSNQAQLALGFQQAISQLGDKVDASTAMLNTNLLTGLCGVRDAVQNDGDKTRALLTGRFQLEDATKINELNAKVVELQSEGRRRADHDDLRLQITNTNTAVAAQAQGQFQAQQQFQSQQISQILGCLPAILGELQIARATNSNILVGNQGVTATGPQNANPTNVRG